MAFGLCINTQKLLKLFLNWKREDGGSHSIIFISDKDKPRIMFFFFFFLFTILHKFFKVLFSIPFSALNSSADCNTPKVPLAAKNTPFFQKRSTPLYVIKNYRFLRFVCTRVRSQSCGEWTTRALNSLENCKNYFFGRNFWWQARTITLS